MALADTLAGVKVALFLNHRCNLRCRYCYNGRSFDRPMPLEVARRAVDFGFERAREGFLLLSFFGGEPLLEIERIEQIVDYARAQAAQRQRRLHFAISTNATLLDDRSVRLLKAHAFHVQVSIDGCRTAQDANRRFANGRSSWHRASSNLRRLLGDRLPVRVVAVIDPANVPFLLDSLESLRALGARKVYFVPNLHADWDAAAPLLEEKMAALADAWGAVLRAGEDLCLDPFNGKVVSHLVRGSRSPTRCAYGAHEFAVSPRGRIYPCDRMVKKDDDDAICLGRIGEPLDEQKLKMIALARERLAPECASCEVRERCANGCGCANQELTGDPGRVSPLLCWYERLVIAQTDRVANALFAEKSPAFLQRFYGGGGGPQLSTRARSPRR
jgi:uncharacterized protein